MKTGFKMDKRYYECMEDFGAHFGKEDCDSFHILKETLKVSHLNTCSKGKNIRYGCINVHLFFRNQ